MSDVVGNPKHRFSLEAAHIRLQVIYVISHLQIFIEDLFYFSYHINIAVLRKMFFPLIHRDKQVRLVFDDNYKIIFLKCSIKTYFAHIH